MRISLTSASDRQQFHEACDVVGVETARPVGRKGHRVLLAERMVQRPRHIVGQADRAQLVIDRLAPARHRGRDFRGPRWRRR